MLDRYRPRDYRAVMAFSRRLENAFYVRLIIRLHSRGIVPGECWVWREAGRVAAFQAVAWLGPEDAFLWGMRVDPRYQNRGIATKMTRALIARARATGRTWVGLNTLESRGDRPTFRVIEKLGFRLEATDATDIYWRRPRLVDRPRLVPEPDIAAQFRRHGRHLLFTARHGWLWQRLRPGIRREVGRHGFRLDGVPVHIVRARRVERGRRHRMVVVNLFAPPANLRAFVPRLLALAPRGRGHLVVSYPVSWAPRFRAAARAAIPGLKNNHGCWVSAWRVYGRTPPPAPLTRHATRLDSAYNQEAR